MTVGLFGTWTSWLGGWSRARHWAEMIEVDVATSTSARLDLGRSGRGGSGGGRERNFLMGGAGRAAFRSVWYPPAVQTVQSAVETLQVLSWVVCQWRCLRLNSSTECAPLGVNRDRYPHVLQFLGHVVVELVSCNDRSSRGAEHRQGRRCASGCRAALHASTEAFWKNFPHVLRARAVLTRKSGIISTSALFRQSLPAVFIRQSTEAFGLISVFFYVKVYSDPEADSPGAVRTRKSGQNFNDQLHDVWRAG